MKNKSKKSLINFSSAIIYKLVVVVVGILLPRLLITSYGSEINGLQASVKQIFTYIALLEAGIGTATIQSLFGPVAKNDRNKINAYISAASNYYNKIGVLYFLVLVVLAAVYCILIPVESITVAEVFVYVIISGALTGINFFYLAKLKLLISAEGDQYIVSTITMVTYLVSSVLKIALIYFGFNIIAVETVYIAVNIAATFFYYLVAKKRYPWLSFKEEPDYTGMEQKNSVMIHKISALIFQNVDILLLTFFCSLETVSIYSMYKMIVDMVTSIVSEIGNSVNFIFGQQFNSKENKSEYNTIIDVFNVYYSAIAFAFYTVTYILIIPFLSIYTLGLDINYIYINLPFFYVIIEFLTVGREAMLRTIDVAGHFKKTQWRTVIEAIINFVGSVTFIIVFTKIFGDLGGIYGALLGTILAMIYRTIDINIYANRMILKRRCTKTFKIMFTNAIIFIIIAIIFKNINLEINNYLEFFISGIWVTPLVVSVFIMVHSVINQSELKYIKRFIKNKIKRREC